MQIDAAVAAIHGATANESRQGGHDRVRESVSNTTALC